MDNRKLVAFCLLLVLGIVGCSSDENSNKDSRINPERKMIESLVINDTLYEHKYKHPITHQEATLKLTWPLISSSIFIPGLDSLLYHHLHYSQVLGETIDETFAGLDSYGEGLSNLYFHIHKNNGGIFSITYTICNKTHQSYCFDHIVNLDLHLVKEIELKSLIAPDKWTAFIALCSGGFNMELGYMNDRVSDDYPDIRDFYEGYEYDIETLRKFELTDSSLVLKYDFDFPSFAQLFEPEGTLEFEWETIRPYLNLENTLVQRLVSNPS